MQLIITVFYVPRCYLHSSNNAKKGFDDFYLGPGLISISPCWSNNIKTNKNRNNKKIIIEFCPTNARTCIFLQKYKIDLPKTTQ